MLASALENESTTQSGNLIGLNTVYDGTSKRPVVGSDTPFNPQNEDGRSYGPISVQKAMNSSVNSVFAQMIVDVTLKPRPRRPRSPSAYRTRTSPSAPPSASAP